VCRSLSKLFFFFSSRRRHTRFSRDWSSDVCSSDLWTSPDAERALTERGREANRRVLDKRLATAPQIDRILVSPYRRARQTAAERSEERRVGKEWRSRWATYE